MTQQDLFAQDAAEKKPSGKSTPEQTSNPGSIESLLTGKAGSHECLILTPNQPLAQQLRRYRLELNDQTILDASHPNACSIDVFNSWLNNSVALCAEKPIANDLQLRWLMELALTKSQAKHPNLNAKHLAPQALAAWRYLRRFSVSQQQLQGAEIGQEAFFFDTVEAMDALVTQRGMTTLELEIERQIAEQIQPSSISANAHTQVCLYAFLDSLPPLFQHWISHRFSSVQHVDYLETGAASGKEAFLYSGTDDADELVASAQWSNHILLKNPSARIGIIHRDLGQNQLRTERLIRTHLEGSHRLSSALKPAASEIGGIQSALGLLQANRFKLTHAQARFIVHSPHWGSSNDYQVRADWDRTLCATQLRHFSFAQLRECIDPSQSEAHLGTNQKLIRFEDIRRRAPKLQTTEQWASFFCQQLETLGWPDKQATENGTKNSSETALQLWFDLLRDFATCSSVAPEIGLSEALTLLQQISDRQRTDPGAAHIGVRLLDTVEAAADYTHLWMIGVDHTRWPSSPRPNPLLPVRLQREFGMPGVDRSLETKFAKQLLERCTQAADQIVFSYSEQDEGVHLSASKLLPDNLQPPDFPKELKDSAAQKYDLEFIDTGNAPELLAEELNVKGGASLLQHMAASPFSAFATFRLAALPLEEPKIGLDALDRGNLVHYMMEVIWKRLETQAELLTLNDSQRAELCKEAAESALRTWQGSGWRKGHSLPREPLSKAIFQLESDRLSHLADRWLAVESERSGFQVQAIEQKLSAALGKLNFQLRIDRIDTLEDGSLLLIDYKTSKQLSTKKWKDEPPAEPQLPLYAISLEEAPTAIAFAQLARTNTRLIGLGATDNSHLETSDNWEAQLNRWRDNLEELANAYAQGDARVVLTPSGFNQRDHLLPIHRAAERETLLALKANGGKRG